MTVSALGLLAPSSQGDPLPPEALPFGRAALRLEAEGLRIVIGDRARDGRLSGVRAVPGGWMEARDVPIVAAYDRFPERSRPEAWRALQLGLVGVPVANPPGVVATCADKLACQALLERHGLALPEVEADPARFADRLRAWGAGFLKPRYGAFGRGIRLVHPGDPLPAQTKGAVEGQLEPTFLQRAVPPPAGLAGAAIRVLVQRVDADTWTETVPIVRCSRRDPVVNAARGADVTALAASFPDTYDRAVARALQVARALSSGVDGAWVVELGVDLVVDLTGHPWVIEVNGRPRGRLEVLAAADPGRWSEDHAEACARPLRTLARTAARG